MNYIRYKMIMNIHKSKVYLRRKEIVIWDGGQHVKKLDHKESSSVGQLFSGEVAHWSANFSKVFFSPVQFTLWYQYHNYDTLKSRRLVYHSLATALRQHLVLWSICSSAKSINGIFWSILPHYSVYQGTYMGQFCASLLSYSEFNP